MISKYIIEFAIYSFLGWLWESIFAVFKTGKWEARGFLSGPICPIYGVSVAIGMVFYDTFVLNGIISLKVGQVFLFSIVVSAIVEYFTSWLLEVLFHAYWWDYKDTPLNINGRVSVPTSLGFGVAGVLVVFYGIPFTHNLIVSIPALNREIIAYLIIIVLTMDVTITVNELINLDMKVKALDQGFNIRISNAVDTFFDKKNFVQQMVYSKIKGFKYPSNITNRAKNFLIDVKNRVTRK